MPGFNGKARYACALGLFVLLTSAVCVSASFAAGRIFIAGLDPSSAYADTTVRVHGGGATPQGTVVAMLGPPINDFIILNNGTGPIVQLPIVSSEENLTLGSTVADASGDWEMRFVTPSVLPGDHHVYVVDKGSLTSDAASLRVLINFTTGVIVTPYWNATSFPFNVTIWPSNVTVVPVEPFLLYSYGSNAVPSSGPPGMLVMLSGTSASGGEIDVYFDVRLVATLVGQHGSWSASFPVPNVVPGNYVIRAMDAQGRWMSVTSFSVTSSPVSLFVPLQFLKVGLVGLFGLAVFSGVTVFMLFFAFLRRRRECSG
jgi:hypothetical protein